MSSHPVARRRLLRSLAVTSGVALLATVLGLPSAGASGASRDSDRGSVAATGSPQVGTAVAGMAANPATPGDFTGYAFDQCLTPTQSAMNAWRKHSPFWGVGIYISGNSRHCRVQPNLTPTWVTKQLAKGWRLLPITLGPQAYCNPRYPKYDDDPVIRKSAKNNYNRARKQGVAEAQKAVAAARALGIVPGSTLWYDLEAFDIKNTQCRLSALRFLHGWTTEIKNLQYVSGAYSSGASGIKAIDDARVNDPLFTEPDRIWVADWSGTPNRFRGAWLRDGAWTPGGRMHQYRGGHNETHGGVTINIDSNYLDLGRGSVAPPVSHCGGVKVDFKRYKGIPKVTTGVRRVTAAQCLLKEAGHYAGALTGVYDAKTEEAIAAFRFAEGFTASPNLQKGIWMALLARGATPVLKQGSASEDVRRLQRALNAALPVKLAVTGTFDASTAAAVRAYQGRVDEPTTGVVTVAVWRKLQDGIR